MDRPCRDPARRSGGSRPGRADVSLRGRGRAGGTDGDDLHLGRTGLSPSALTVYLPLHLRCSALDTRRARRRSSSFDALGVDECGGVEDWAGQGVWIGGRVRCET